MITQKQNNIIKTKKQKLNPKCSKMLKYGLVNARSVNNKTEIVSDFIIEHDLDVLGITETWLQSNDSFTTNNITPSGFSIVSNPRINKRGGGVAIIIKNDFTCRRLATASFSTFEVLLVQVTSSMKFFVIATIYRSPGPLRNFLSELSDFLSTLVAKYDNFLLAGDFNIHMDIKNDESSKKLCAVLNTFGLKQHVDLPTHAGGHILDLVISRDSTPLVESISVEEGISDHHSVFVDISIAMKKRNVVKKTFHQFKKLDIVKFQQDILTSELHTNPSTDVDVLATQYHNVVSNLVSIHAPMITQTVTSRPPAPWYTPEIALARQERRRLERRWRHTKLTVDREIFVAQKLLVNNMLVNAKSKYYVGLAKIHSHNPAHLWATINSLSLEMLKPRFYLSMNILLL